ncbi:MAG: hypothetical protein JNN30_20100 [Rhodanobacteraceae bacterium]|nr:hypothetical protein [Rhodanobacteraceae bacterium]
MRSLSAAQRQAILARSPWEHGWFQGEGYHIFLKDEPDLNKAFAGSVGEVPVAVAEDWIIMHTLRHEQQQRDRT